VRSVRGHRLPGCSDAGKLWAAQKLPSTQRIDLQREDRPDSRWILPVPCSCLDFSVLVFGKESSVL